MKAARIHEYGGPEVLRIEEAERPTPAAGELLVRVGAAALNPVDWKIRAGYLDFLNHTLPLTLGCDVAGTVESAGADVTGFQPGDSVYAFIDLHRLGAFAGYLTVKAAEAAHKPKSLDDVHAASVPVAALTSWQAIFDEAGLQSGQTILIHAAAGGVGSMAVQLAKWKGARVIGTASEANAAYVTALGAHEVIDYRKTPFEKVTGKVDVVFDTMGGDTRERSFGILKPGGYLVSLVMPAPAHENVRASTINVKTNGKRLAEIAQMVDDGILKTLVETVLPLDEAAKAIALCESGHARGKIVMIPS